MKSYGSIFLEKMNGSIFDILHVHTLYKLQKIKFNYLLHASYIMFPLDKNNI